MVLTVASLLCLFVVFMGGLNKGDPNLRSLYYFKADTTDFQKNITSSGILSTSIPLTNVDDKIRTLINKLLDAHKDKNLKDIYEVYMWNYCSGTKDNGTSGGVKLDFCSPRKAQFWFDPVEVWGLNGTGITNILPSEFNKGLSLYHKASTWMFVAYTLSFWVTAASIVVGLLAICSRWGSCATTIVSSAATLFTFLAALTSTIVFSTLTGAFNSVLKPYGIHLTVGTKMMSLDWLAFAFSLGATLFWTISICCCSGKSDKSHNNEKPSKGFKPFASRGASYQPLGEEGHALAGGHARGGSHVEMDNFGAAGSSPYKGRETAYEPFRHERV